jgi:hypothetical protein
MQNFKKILHYLIWFASRAKQRTRTRFREKVGDPSDGDALHSPLSSCDEEDEVNHLLAEE